MKCNICSAALAQPIYEAVSHRALTSLCELIDGQARVWSCSNCGHLCGEEMPNTKEFYATDYRILLDHEDEDQIYEVQSERIIYRTEHQIYTLLNKLQLPENSLILDYGCAKASTPKRLLSHRPDLQLHLFDVSEMYTTYWDKLISPDRYAVNKTPSQWGNKFDVITSYFALEHIPSPVATIQHIASLLNESGVFYGIVPDTFGNVADFVVIDHVNHFTASSLHFLLNGAGFTDIKIDANVHRGALVFTARKSKTMTSRPVVSDALKRAKDLASFWTQINERILTAEKAHGDAPVAIYGSGFYGAYIASTLTNPGRLHCFLDRSPYQQKKTLFGKLILAPEQLPIKISTLYVGLNPTIARASLANLEFIKKRDIKLIFLDEIES